MRRVFKTRTFARWSRKAGLVDAALRAAVVEMAAGLIDADLGGRVYKIAGPAARQGQERRGAYADCDRSWRSLVLPVRIREERAG